MMIVKSEGWITFSTKGLSITIEQGEGNKELQGFIQREDREIENFILKEKDIVEAIETLIEKEN